MTAVRSSKGGMTGSGRHTCSVLLQGSVSRDAQLSKSGSGMKQVIASLFTPSFPSPSSLLLRCFTFSKAAEGKNLKCLCPLCNINSTFWSRLRIQAKELPLDA